MALLSRLKQDYRTNASRLHKAVGDLLRSSPLFSNYRVYQEYPVNRISPYFDSGREKFDWVILDLMVVIECHGEQHYMPVCFGGISEEEAELKFRLQQQRDEDKKLAVQKAGWTYVVFKYDEEDISVASLMRKISESNQSTQRLPGIQQGRDVVARQVRSRHKPARNEEYHQQQLERAREYRKQRYQQLKSRRKSRG